MAARDDSAFIAQVRAVLAGKRYELGGCTLVERGSSKGWHISFHPAAGIPGLPEHTFARTGEELLAMLRLWPAAGTRGKH